MRVTEAQIKRLIHQSNLIEGYDDPEMDAQGLWAWRYLLELPFDHLKAGDVMKVQKIITNTQDDLQPDQRGYYRKVAVMVGGRVCPTSAMVPHLMENWLLDYQAMDPIIAHVRFEHIHPFVDGNGRTGRLLLWWTQMHLEETLTKITFKERQSYYRWFR